MSYDLAVFGSDNDDDLGDSDDAENMLFDESSSHLRTSHGLPVTRTDGASRSYGVRTLSEFNADVMSSFGLDRLADVVGELADVVRRIIKHGLTFNEEPQAAYRMRLFIQHLEDPQESAKFNMDFVSSIPGLWRSVKMLDTRTRAMVTFISLLRRAGGLPSHFPSVDRKHSAPAVHHALHRPRLAMA